MTISAVVPDIAFAGSSGSGTMGPFSLVKNGTPIVFYNNSDIVVYRYDTVTDTAPVLLEEGTDYDLTGGPTAGSITLTSPQTGLLTAERLHVYRRSTLAQSLDLVNGGNFSAANLERRLDITETKLQELDRDLKSTIRFAMFDTDVIPGTLPLGAVIDKIAYVTGSASSPLLATLDASALGNLVALTDSDKANLSIVAADLNGADTIGAVATVAAEVATLAPRAADIGTVATAIAAGTINDLLDGQIGKVDTYALLDAQATEDDQVVFVSGRLVPNDGGQGLWIRDTASAATVNGATVRTPSAGTGRYLRLTSADEYLLDWLCVGDGTTDDKASILALMTDALAKQRPLIGNRTKTYGVNGTLTSPGLKMFRDVSLIQLTPGDVRTLVSDGHDGLRWSRITVDRNGDGTLGALENSRAISILGGSDCWLEDVAVTGDDMGTCIFLSTLVDSGIIRPRVVGLRFSTTGATDDVLQGLWINAGTNVHVIDPFVSDLQGNNGSGVQRRFTRAITAAGTTGLRITGGYVGTVDQGVDLTGSAANVDFIVSNVRASMCNAYSFKAANIPANGQFVNLVSRKAGLAHVAINSANGATRCEDIIVKNVQAIGMDSTSTFAADANTAYFRVFDTGTPADDPQGIVFVNCTGVTGDGVAPEYGYLDDTPSAAGNRANRFVGGYIEAADTALYSKDGRTATTPDVAVSLRDASGTQSIPNSDFTRVQYDTTTRDLFGWE